MPQKIQILRTSTPNQQPAALAPGELAIEMASLPPKLWVGVPTIVDASGMKMLLPSGGGVTVSELPPTTPLQGALWYESDTGILWMYYDDGTSTQWVQVNGVSAGGGSSVTVADVAPASPAQGDLWWEADTGILWIWFEDVTSSQWVQAAAGGAVGISGGAPVDAYTKSETDAQHAQQTLDFVNVTGDTMTGTLNVSPALNVGGTALDGTVITGYRGDPAVMANRRWSMALGDHSTETASPDGSMFNLICYNNDGTPRSSPFQISRYDGRAYFNAHVMITSGYPHIILDTVGAGGSAGWIGGAKDSSMRWEVGLGHGVETGSNWIGSNFYITAYDNSGVPGNNKYYSLYVERMTGNFTVTCVEAFKTTAGPWAGISDARVKTVLGDYTQGLAALKQLTPIRYTLKGNVTTHDPIDGKAQPSDHATAGSKESIGLVAQVAETVMPEMIGQRAGWIDGARVTDLRTFDPNALTYALINAVKELSAANDALAARVAALEGAP